MLILIYNFIKNIEIIINLNNKYYYIVIMLFTEEQLYKWNNNKLINPITNKKIKLNGPTYKKYFIEYNNFLKKKENNKLLDSYKKYREDKIDPLLHITLPIDTKYSDKDLFKFEYKWNPYTGDRLDIIEENGPLYFDPDTLIHYFYVNRMNNLWIYNNDNFNGYYGDALGNGPNFNIVGRGDYRNWYLFRLPIPDCYLYKDNNLQSVTMGPKLTDKEIKEIYTKAKRYGNNYYINYKKKRPNLIKLKFHYEKSISNNPDNFDKEILNDNYVKKLIYNINTKNVYILSKM